MAFCLLNGEPVSEARISLPRVGVWHADVALESDAEVGPGVFLTAGGGELALAGTVRRGGVFSGTRVLRVVGGAGGFLRPVAAKNYRDAPLSLPLREILAAGGETLSAEADVATLARNLPHWVCASATVAIALTALLTGLGVAWRVLPDGHTWVGPEAWGPAAGGGELLGESPVAGLLALAGTAPGLLPGTTLAGKRVSYVEHRFRAESLRTLAWLEDG